MKTLVVCMEKRNGILGKLGKKEITAKICVNQGKLIIEANNPDDAKMIEIKERLGKEINISEDYVKAKCISEEASLLQEIKKALEFKRICSYNVVDSFVISW